MQPVVDLVSPFEYGPPMSPHQTWSNQRNEKHPSIKYIQEPEFSPLFHWRRTTCRERAFSASPLQARQEAYMDWSTYKAKTGYKTSITFQRQSLFPILPLPLTRGVYYWNYESSLFFLLRKAKKFMYYFQEQVGLPTFIFSSQNHRTTSSSLALYAIKVMTSIPKMTLMARLE